MSSDSMPDFRRMTEGLNRLTSDMQLARQEIESVDVHGASPDGMVRATMRSGRLVAVTIDPAALDDQDTVRLAGQMLGAVQDCEQRSAEMIHHRTAPMSSMVRQLFGEAAPR